MNTEPNTRLHIAALIAAGPLGNTIAIEEINKAKYEIPNVPEKLADTYLRMADALIAAEEATRDQRDATTIRNLLERCDALQEANRKLQCDLDDRRAQINSFLTNFKQVADKARGMGLLGPIIDESNKTSETWWDWTLRLCTELRKTSREIRQCRQRIAELETKDNPNA